MSEMQALNLLLPQIYKTLAKQRNIHTLLSLAATCKNFHRLYKEETSISNNVATIKQLYQSIQTMWQQGDTVDYCLKTEEVHFAFKNKQITIYPSVGTRSWTYGSVFNERPNSNGKMMVTLNISILNNERLKIEDLYELGRMVMIPTLLKRQMYCKQNELMFEVQYEMCAIDWEWSYACSNRQIYLTIHMDHFKQNVGGEGE